MQFELEGKLIEKFETQKISDRFQKREFVVETEENNGGRVFTEQIKFQLTQDKCGLLDKFNLNEPLKVSFNIRGRKWEKNGNVNYFTNLEAWKMEKVGNDQAAPAQTPPLPDEEPAFDDFNSNNSGPQEEDDLPF